MSDSILENSIETNQVPAAENDGGLSPTPQEKTPSFSISPHLKPQFLNNDNPSQDEYSAAVEKQLEAYTHLQSSSDKRDADYKKQIQDLTDKHAPPSEYNFELSEDAAIKFKEFFNEDSKINMEDPKVKLLQQWAESSGATQAQVTSLLDGYVQLEMDNVTHMREQKTAEINRFTQRGLEAFDHLVEKLKNGGVNEKAIQSLPKNVETLEMLTYLSNIGQTAQNIQPATQNIHKKTPQEEWKANIERLLGK